MEHKCKENKNKLDIEKHSLNNQQSIFLLRISDRSPTIMINFCPFCGIELIKE